MSRCLALLLAVLLLFPPEADLADTLRAAMLAGDAVEALGGFRAFPRGAGGWSPVEVCLSGEGFGRGPLVLLRSDGGEVRCFTLRRRRRRSRGAFSLSSSAALPRAGLDPGVETGAFSVFPASFRRTLTKGLFLPRFSDIIGC